MKKIFKRIIPPIFIDLYKYLRFKIKDVDKPKWHEVKKGPVKGKEILVNIQNGYYSQMVEGVYDNYLYNGVKENVFKGKAAIDIGCHIGYHSLGFSDMVGSGEVYAIDPNPFNLERLKKIKKKNLIRNIQILNIGISDKPGNLKFNFSKNVDDMTSSGGYIEGTQTPLDKMVYKKAGFEEKLIRVKTIDGLVSENSIKNLGLIKIDVEGHEVNVLKGAAKTLKQQLPVILIEIHTIQAMYKIGKIFQSLGYKSDILHTEDDGRLFLKYYKK